MLNELRQVLSVSCFATHSETSTVGTYCDSVIEIEVPGVTEQAVSLPQGGTGRGISLPQNLLAIKSCVIPYAESI